MTAKWEQVLQQLSVSVACIPSGKQTPLGALDRPPARRLREDHAARSRGITRPGHDCQEPREERIRTAWRLGRDDVQYLRRDYPRSEGRQPRPRTGSVPRLGQGDRLPRQHSGLAAIRPHAAACCRQIVLGRTYLQTQCVRTSWARRATAPSTICSLPGARCRCPIYSRRSPLPRPRTRTLSRFT